MKWVVFAGWGLVLAAAGGVALGSWSGDDKGDSVSDPLGTRRGDELTVKFQAAAERSRVKSEVAAALVRGELSIEDAAAAYQKVLAADPVVLTRLRLDWPQASERELVLRNLEAFVRWQHRSDPARVPAVLARLAEAIGRVKDGNGLRATVMTVQ